MTLYCCHCMSVIPDGSIRCECCGNSTVSNAAPHHLKAGTLLNNRYLVGDAIGEGGFGITYIGVDINLNMKIAVKEFYPHGYANRNNSVSNSVALNYSKETEYFNNAKERFLYEAQSIARFSKENAIVDVRDYFTENDTAYIVMEFIEGVTLARYIKQNGVFDAADIFRRMLPLMEALGKMHRDGIIHRDISPDNIMITDDGSLKLMDFGSARYYSGDNKRTMSVILKPGYAPFEQYSQSGDQGPWTDVYALCATLYKCICGKTPPDAMTRCQRDTMIYPSAMGIRIEPTLENALMRGLAVYPNDRPQSVDELICAVRDICGQSPRAAGSDDLATRLADDPGSNITSRTYGDREMYSDIPRSESSANGKKHSVTAIIIIVTAAALIIVGVVAFFLLKNNNPNTDTAPTVFETEPSPTEVRHSAEPTSGTVTMPNVIGKKLEDAKAQLEGLGLKVESEYEANDEISAEYIIRQSVDENRALNPGDSVMLYVSSGKAATEAPQSAASSSQKEQSRSFDVEEEVRQIRVDYYATQDDPGTEINSDGVTYYHNNGTVLKIKCAEGTNGWDYTRQYYYKNDKLYFAFVNNGTEEYRLYFADDTLIRYIDDNGSVSDYGSISCPMESAVFSEAYKLLAEKPF